MTILHDETLDVEGELTTGNMRKLRSKSEKTVPIKVALVMIGLILGFDTFFDLFDYYITLTLAALGLILCISAMVFIEFPSPLYDNDDVTNRSIKEGRNLLETIWRIISKS